MQFGNSLQSSLEHLLPCLHRDLLPDKLQEVIVQVLVHKDALIQDGVTW